MTARKDRKRARGADSANGGVANGGPSPENWPASKVELWDLDRIQPYERNPKVHPDSQIALIAASMLEDGVTAPILVDEAGVIIYGHGRRLAAIKNGFSRYPVVQAIGWPEDRKRAVRIKDNSFAALATWNAELIKIEITDLKMSGYNLPLLGFPESQLRGFGVSMGTEGADPEAAPEPPAVPVSRLGDVWILDKHRLLCGDSTKADDVRTSLSGAQPHLMVTDPPYGVDYDPTWSDGGPNGKRAANRASKHQARGKVVNDHRADWREAWDLFTGDVAYIWHADRECVVVAASLLASGFSIRAQIVWAKQKLIITRGHYHYQHEPLLYCVRDGKTGHWEGGRQQSTLWQIVSDPNTTGHGTQKPVECMKRPIENNSKAGDAVYEPFSGSGTTIIAAEMTGRRCLAIELDPGYVDVGALRWQTFTKQEAVLESTGKTFAETKAERTRKTRRSGTRSRVPRSAPAQSPEPSPS